MDLQITKDEDSLLIQKMKNGDENAIDEFVRRYYPDILKYGIRHLASQEDAQDMTQEVFVRFFSTFSSYRHYGKAKNYLYVIAKHLCIDIYKNRTLYVPLNENIQIEEINIKKEDQITLKYIVETLPDPLFDVIDLYYFQGLKIKEIAKVLNIGIPLVKYRLRQAKQLIKKEMEMGQ